jgi:hypothetical protein
MAIGDTLQLLQRITDMASDNVIMPEEKRELKREWDIITAEYSTVLAQATEESSEEIAYMAKYAALLLYLYGIGGTNPKPLFDDMTVKSEWEGIGDEVRLVFKEYFVAREAVALGGLRAPVDPSVAKPDSIVDIFPVATRDSIVITWAWPLVSLKNKIARHLIDVSYDEGDTWTRFVSTGNPTYTYIFDRAVDGYPEKNTVTVPGPIPLSKYRFRVRPENIYGYQAETYGPSATGKIVDVTNYGTWIPPVPVLVPYCNGREAVINWNNGNQYGKFGYDVQVFKKDTLPSEDEWLKPDITLDARANENNYTDGTTGVYFTPVEQISQTLPLKDQTVSTPKDTKFYYRVRGVSIVPLSTNLTRTLLGTWSAGVSVLARPTGTVDIVAQAIGAAQIAEGAVVAHTLLAENLAAINAKLGTINGDTPDYKLIMSPGTGDPDPEGTFLLGSDGSGDAPEDTSFFRRWRENGLWKLAIKLQSFFVTAIASVIVGRFQVKSTSSADPDLDVDPSDGSTKISTSLNIGSSSQQNTRLKIKENVGVAAVTFTGTGVNDLNILTDGAVEGDFEVKIKSAPQEWTEAHEFYEYVSDAAFGNSIYVVSCDDNKVYTSPDAITWTERATFPSYSSCLVFQNNIFILATSYPDYKIYTSSDGIYWTEKHNFGVQCSSIIYEKAIYVFGLNNNKIYTSTNLITFTERLSLAGSSQVFVAFGNNVFVVSVASKIYTSSDALTWTEQVFTITKYRLFFGKTLFHIATVNTLYTSPDGITWTQRQNIGSVAFEYDKSDSLLIIGCANGDIFTSVDEYVWTKRQTLPPGIYGFTYGDSGFLAGAGDKKAYLFTPQLFAWREITGAWSADLPLYANYTYELTGYDITFQFVTENEHILDDLWEFSQGQQKAISVQDSAGTEVFELNNGKLRLKSVQFCEIIRPLTGTVSANTVYTIPEGEAVYTCIIPKEYLVASSGGPFTLTITTGVSGKENVVVPIASTAYTIKSPSLNFIVYVDSVGNVISEYFSVAATSTADTRCGLTFGGYAGGMTYYDRVIYYEKTKNRCFLSIYYYLNQKGTSIGNAVISALPFKTANISSSYCTGGIYTGAGVSLSGPATFYTIPNSNNLYLNLQGGAQMTHANFSNGADVMITFSYPTDD